MESLYVDFFFMKIGAVKTMGPHMHDTIVRQ